MKTLTTGEIAKFCDVNQRTVIRWIDKGALKGFKLPGRGNNRVKVEDFVSFLKENGMPIPEAFSETVEKKILVVDDEPAVANAIKRTLRPITKNVVIAQGGFEAGTKLMMVKPDLITLDLSMPDMDGFEVIRYVRGIDEIATTKILVISALPDPELERALLDGADAILSKPFDNKTLKEKVSELLELNF